MALTRLKQRSQTSRNGGLSSWLLSLTICSRITKTLIRKRRINSCNISVVKMSCRTRLPSRSGSMKTKKIQSFLKKFAPKFSTSWKNYLDLPSVLSSRYQYAFCIIASLELNYDDLFDYLIGLIILADLCLFALNFNLVKDFHSFYEEVLP